MYGTVVSGYTGYTATDVTEWKLLYVDEENKDAFLISSNTIEAPQPTENGIPILSKYSGSNNVKSFEYGKKYNGLWLEKCTSEATYNSAKTVAYICDPSNWEMYKTGKAKYVAGGPTSEVMTASYYNKQISDFKNAEYDGDGSLIKNVNKSYAGYPSVPSWIYGELYCTEKNYWLASHGGYNANDMRCVRDINPTIIGRESYNNNNIGLRPVVCFSASDIKIEGENLSV